MSIEESIELGYKGERKRYKGEGEDGRGSMGCQQSHNSNLMQLFFQQSEKEMVFSMGVRSSLIYSYCRLYL